MRTIPLELFQTLVASSAIRPRIKRDVRFVNATSNQDWGISELIPVGDRSGNKGIIILEDDEANLYLAGYELSRGLTSSTGKAQPIICDFCRTWQTGSRSGSITIHRPGRDTGAISFLCCADLRCSEHVRSLTSASRTSRAQLREDMNNDQRIARLKVRIREIAQLLGLQPIPDNTL